MKILLIDDHPLFRAGICTIIAELDEQVQPVEASSCEEAMKLISAQDNFDLILLDLNLPGMDGLTGLHKLRNVTPSTPIVVLSASEDHASIKEAITQGAKGYIPKSASSAVILSAIHLVFSGGIYLPMAIFDEDKICNKPDKVVNQNGEILTKRQRDVLVLVAQGKTNKSIALLLNMAENTVRVHVAAIMKFFDANNRTEATYVAKQQGLL